MGAALQQWVHAAEAEVHGLTLGGIDVGDEVLDLRGPAKVVLIASFAKTCLLHEQVLGELSHPQSH
jgi:hypothetical protein